MKTDIGQPLDCMSEEDLQPLLELLQGGNPDDIARKAGITRDRLFQIRDELMVQCKAGRNGAMTKPSKQVGRNDPCPCGSGKKYKHCCLKLLERDENTAEKQSPKVDQAKAEEQEKLIRKIETAFSRLKTGQYDDALDQTTRLLAQYPNEDRLHDIYATSLLYAGDFKTSIAICKRRMEAAESEKAYFVKYGRYRDAEVDQPTLSYYYPPLTWMQKYWIALKAEEYHSQLPPGDDGTIIERVTTLKSADDTDRFPEKHAQGLNLRREALKDTLEELKAGGPDVIPYLLPLATKYSWAGLFVPEILSAITTDFAGHILIDISMFGFAYASGACLHFLERRGESVIPLIRNAFAENRFFDPIKTGLVSVLGNIRTPLAFETLLDLLDHSSPHIVNWAGDALGRFNRVDVLPTLEKASRRIGGEKMIESAVQRLRDLEPANG